MMSKIGFAPTIKIISSFILLIFIIGCAEIGSPPGGDVDKVKPRIISSQPANGSTMVEPSNTIRIRFSERIVKPISKNPVYISPRPKSNPKIDWKSDNVTITLPDSFDVDQTYIISFADGIQDLRRNPLDSGSIIAFTTGENLAAGVIDGIVVDKNNIPQKNIISALYNKDIFSQELVIDSLYPTYMVVTNDAGAFSFQYIPNGEYQLLAFTDKNKNDRLDLKTELFGLPYNSIILDSSHTKRQNLNLALTSHQESEPTISSVRQTDDNLFRIDIDFKSYKPSLSLQNYQDSTNIYSNHFIIDTDTTSNRSILAYFGILPEGNYKLLFNYEDTLLMFDSIQVKEFSDEKEPEIKSFQSENIKIFKDSLNVQIQFTEPLDTSLISKETFYFIDIDSNLTFPDFEFLNLSLCSLSNNFLIEDINKYLLHISEFDIIDLAGNKMGDSTTKKEINLINPDSLGTIKGAIVRDKQSLSEAPVILYFKNTATKQLSTYFSDDNLFDLQLLQGNYILSGFIDSDKNDTRDFGTLYPLQYAEPFTTYSDTIKVRARFETTDIQLEFK